MPKFNCSYAYDISCYFDFAVEADTEEEAEKKCEEALANGAFEEVIADPSWDSGSDNHRVFTQGEITEGTNTADQILVDGKLVDQPEGSEV